MILIAPQIIETLKAATYPIAVSVRDFYSTDKVSASLITVDELPGNNGVYLDNQPAIVTNTFTIEVYASTKTVNGFTRNQKQLALDILQVVDKTLNEVYGLTMTGQVAIAPYTDSSICRAVARYIAYIDTRKNTENILRGL